jgi:hypothetical protein
LYDALNSTAFKEKNEYTNPENGRHRGRTGNGNGCSTMGGSSWQQDEPPPPANPNFAAEMNKFNAQFPNEKASKYEDISLNYNNAKKLDERGNCHDIASIRW